MTKRQRSEEEVVEEVVEKKVKESKEETKATVLSEEKYASTDLDSQIQLSDCPQIFFNLFEDPNQVGPVKDSTLRPRVANKPSEWVHHLFCNLPQRINFTSLIDSDDENSDDEEEEEEKEEGEPRFKEMTKTVQGISYVLECKDDLLKDLDNKEHKAITIMMRYHRDDVYGSSYDCDPSLAKYSWYPSYDDQKDEEKLTQEQAHQLLATNLNLAETITLRVLCEEEIADEERFWNIDGFTMFYNHYKDHSLFCDLDSWNTNDGPCDWHYGEVNTTLLKKATKQ
jgi:hypothetical protein